MLTLSILAGDNRLNEGREGAEVPSLFGYADESTPLPAVRDNSDPPALIHDRPLTVLLIGGVVYLSEVDEAIVITPAIDVVDLIDGPFASHDCPGYTMSGCVSAEELANEIPLVVSLDEGRLSSKATVPPLAHGLGCKPLDVHELINGASSPLQFAGDRIVIDQLPKEVGGW